MSAIALPFSEKRMNRKMAVTNFWDFILWHIGLGARNKQNLQKFTLLFVWKTVEFHASDFDVIMVIIISTKRRALLDIGRIQNFATATM